MMFLFRLPLAVNSVPLLLGAVLFLGIWGFLLLRKSISAIVAVVLLSVVELVVLLAWLRPITAAAVFNQHPLDLNAKVFPPSVENLVMPFVWVGIFASIAVAAWRGFVVKRQSLRLAAILHVTIWTVAQLVLLSAVWCNLNNFRRMPRDPFNVESVSPNEMWTVRLVPMNCWIDRNGLVIVRRRGAFWWRPVAELGDILTECDQARFEWKTDSSGFALLGHHLTRNEDLRLLDHEIQFTAVPSTTHGGTYQDWQTLKIILPDGMGTLTFMRVPSHPFLAEYDRKVRIETAVGTSSFDIPPNTGGRTQINLYLVKRKTSRELWLRDAHDWNSAYVFDVDALSFEILGQNKYWTKSTQRGPGGSPTVTMPPKAELIGTITGIRKPPWLYFRKSK